MSVRLRVLPKTIVPVPTAETKDTRWLQRVSTAQLDRTEESVKVPMDTLEKVDGVLGKHQRGAPSFKHSVAGIGDKGKTANEFQWSKRKHKTKNAAVLGSSRRALAGAEFLGVLGRAAQVSRTPQTEPARDHRVGHGPWKATRRGRRDGRRTSWVNERNIFCESASTRGRKAHGGSDVGNARVLKNGTQVDAQSVEGSTWLATPVPISIAKALPVADVGGYGKSAYAAGSQAHGNRVTFGVSDVLETGKADERTQTRLDRGQGRCFGQLEFDRLSARKKPPDKDRNLGRSVFLDCEWLGWMGQRRPRLKIWAWDDTLWPCGVLEFGTQFRKATGTL